MGEHTHQVMYKFNAVAITTHTATQNLVSFNSAGVPQSILRNIDDPNKRKLAGHF